MKQLLFFSLTFLLVACSGSRPAADTTSAGIELADSIGFADEGAEDFISDNLSDEFAADALPADSMLADTMPSQSSDDIFAEGSAVQLSETGTYQVKENETLMMIAFNIYGDYSKWREIARLNQNLLGGSNSVKAGMELIYEAPSQPFIYAPSGNPYLIVEGDTLGKVSDKTYGTTRHWKDIWTNNEILIKDPNLIFAGFTIYTPVLEGRDVAFDGE